ncbi:EVE domain-containing protein [Pseudoalteromonas sp. T1lg23B]|uniref:EVE domain-containing protein n=1 Tax=Pseudoalteromonas sp. T1lg23B TaxID=2077097 RepID=UPI000CF73727|nr:EVE domain-containing protein [Pseudoalteromonas sp. T1lg23B]
MAYWLFKTEPDTFSIDDLKSAGEQGSFWDGVRNYQARNFLRDQVQLDDRVFIYHSSCKVPAIVGIAKVITAAQPDPYQFDPKSAYFDAKSKPEDPRWFGVTLQYVQHLRPISLASIKANPDIKDLALKKASRLSIMPVSEQEWGLLTQN